jgi:N-acetylglucosamine-6-phosphate deacetylase
MLYFDNATVHTTDGIIDHGSVLVDGRRIVAVGPRDAVERPDAAHVIDASGRTIVPGFIDLQINGAFGSDFTDDPSSIWRVAGRLPRFGVTAFLPTIITSPLDTIARAQSVVTGAPPAGFNGARPLGLHVEGPFLNPAKKGAHNPAYLRLPTPEVVAEWSPSTGIRLVTLAPELPGALPVIAALAARGVLVSTGHSNGAYADAIAAFDAGARYGTHLFNAMSAFGHREPGLPGALLTDRRPTVGLIADGVHTHESVVALAWRMLGPARLNLVSDAMAALGMPPGRHRLADADVVVDGTSARLEDGTLAGSILSPDQALRNLIRFTGCAFDDAVRTVTATPARALGIDVERGRVAAGALADLTVLSPDLQVIQTVVEGTLVFDAVR